MQIKSTHLFFKTGIGTFPLKANHIALVGLGSIGKRHLGVLRHLRPDLEISVVRSGFGALCAEESLANRTVFSIEQALQKGARAFILASPASLHIEQALQCIRGGTSHILIEKPLSSDTKKINELLTLAENYRTLIQVGYVLRFDPSLIFFRERAMSRALGKILHVKIECGSYLPDWRLGQDYRESVSARSELGGGVLLELSHELDYAYWLFGPFQDLQARCQKSHSLGLSVEEAAHIVLTNQEGVLISILIDFNRRLPQRRCVIQGTEGELIWDGIERFVQWNPLKGYSEVRNFFLERDDLYRAQLINFLECIEKGQKPKVSFEESIEVMKLIDHSRNSDQWGKRVML